MKKILFITNGHGEDIVAARIINELGRKDVAIDVMPVVGKGDTFKGLGVRLIGPLNVLPSGGFGLRNYSYLIKDIFSGLIAKVLSQIKALKRNEWSYRLVIGIGDIVPIMYSMITKCPFIFVGVNKSDHYRKLAFNYTHLEKLLLRKYCQLTLARDMRTAKALASCGINATYVGNPMMDGVMRDVRLNVRGARKGKTIGFLPGTREDAYKNIEDFFKIAWHIRQLDKKIKFILSIPASLDKDKIAKIKKPMDVPMANNFNNVLSRSSIIIGLSGTGNEQAAGLGIPVISFPGRGAQFNSRFASGQKELLGNALLLLQRDLKAIAEESVKLLKDKKRMLSMGNAGRKRMGGPGASKQIAEMIDRQMKALWKK
ncbi:MAG: DUF354 domain-containing protein [bacterium]